MEGRRQQGESKDKVAAMGFLQQQQQQLGCFSDEVDSRDGGKEEQMKEARSEPAGSAWGGESTVAKRRRGRPPGSKNKPKPPVVITREADPAAAMRPHVLEIPGGGDVADALAGFVRRRGLGICVLAGTGVVANVSLRHPLPSAAEISGAAAAVVVFHGRYEILSMSATFLPPAMSAEAPRALGGLSISLAGPHGQIVGGAVAGPLVAATTVVVVAAAFTRPTFHRLPAEDDASASLSGGGAAAEADEHRGRQAGPQKRHHSLAPAPTHQPVPIYTSASQPQELWAPAPAASAPRPRPPYQ